MQVFISLSIVSWLHCWIGQRTSDRAGEDAEYNRCGVTFQSTVGAHSCSGLTGKLMGFCFLLFRWKSVKVGGCTGGSFRGAASDFGKHGLCLFSIIKAPCVRFSTIWWWHIALRTMVILHQIPFECPTWCHFLAVRTKPCGWSTLSDCNRWILLWCQYEHLTNHDLQCVVYQSIFKKKILLNVKIAFQHTGPLRQSMAIYINAN